MAKRLQVNAATGVIMIGNDTLPAAALTSPQSYLTDLNFHSGLDYMQLKQTISCGSLTFSAIAREIVTWDSGKSGCF